MIDPIPNKKIVFVVVLRNYIYKVLAMSLAFRLVYRSPNQIFLSICNKYSTIPTVWSPRMA